MYHQLELASSSQDPSRCAIKMIVIMMIDDQRNMTFQIRPRSMTGANVPRVSLQRTFTILLILYW